MDVALIVLGVYILQGFISTNVRDLKAGDHIIEAGSAIAARFT